MIPSNLPTSHGGYFEVAAQTDCRKPGFGIGFAAFVS